MQTDLNLEPPVSSTDIPENPVTSEVAFPIVGIGASAGGLEAFENFFSHTRANSGMAFVLVTHLDPTHVSQLTEILQRSTLMPVIEAFDQLKVAPNCVYVIPPNKDMEIFQGKLQLSQSSSPYGQRRVIDCFLQSLANDHGQNAIGILLSGMGSDGTKGLCAIMNNGGVTLVQDPTTAKYENMPASAIMAGCASHVLPVEKMPELLRTDIFNFDMTAKVPCTIVPSSIEKNNSRTGINRILMQLRHAGRDFTQYKITTIGRRIERRMAKHHIENIEIYSQYLKSNPSEVELLTKELLINVTGFFRDKEPFELLENEVLPNLCGNCESFRVWVAGCSTGEEAYSIAILLHELMAKTRREFNVEIYATDLDENAIAVARAGIYLEKNVKNVSPERLDKFFIEKNKTYQIKKEIRDMAVFAVQNVIKDPPFSKLDLLSCRNLMIYLTAELQNQLIPMFHYALKPGGVLFLSPSESICNHTELFSVISRRWKLYHANTCMKTTIPFIFIDKNNEMPDKKIGISLGMKLSELTNKMLAQFFAPASVITNIKGEILYIHGDTGKYLSPAPGVAIFNVISMALDGLKLPLQETMNIVSYEKISVLNREVCVKTDDGQINISLSVCPLPDLNDDLSLLLISFRDANTPVIKKQIRRLSKNSTELERLTELESHFSRMSEGYSATIEELQVSNQELMSSNEELQSTNEELQSTNEELETSKEELQSTNEELISVNAELHDKIVQLTEIQDDIKNLLENTNSGIIFLDRNLVIRRFTSEARCLYRLIESDVGRPLKDIRAEVNNIDLLDAAQIVLDTLIPYEREINIQDNTILVRIQPYRTLNNVIAGVVLTFINR